MASPSEATRLTGDGKRKTLKVMYLFAGRQRHSDIGAFLRKAEKSGKFRLVLMEFDIERSPDHDLTDDALWDKIFALLKEGNWVLIVSPPCNTFSRARFQHQQHPGPKPLRTRAWPKGFPWLSDKNKSKVLEANLFVERSLKGCEIVATTGGFFILEHPEDLGTVQGEQPGSIWQWEELLDLIPKLAAVCFAIQQCHFGGLTPKPTRFLVNMKVNDPRCYISLPQFDKAGYYKGPLPKDCGHVHSHKLIGKTASRWNTAPSASYPSQLCEFLANLIINATASCGGGPENEIPAQPEVKKRKLSNNISAQVETCDVDLSCKSAGSSGTGKLDIDCSAVDTTTLDKAPVSSGTVDSASSREKDTRGGLIGEQIVVSDSEAEHETVGDQACGSAGLQFDMDACFNTGRPIQVEWDRTQRGFVDGFGLCSPCRWKPHQRGTRRTHDMIRLADDTFNLLVEGVKESILDLRLEAFKLVTGKLTQSPFKVTALQKIRSKWFSLLKDPDDAAVLDEGQPFFLSVVAVANLF